MIDALEVFLTDVKSIVGQCSYKKGWELSVTLDKKGVYIQIKNTTGVCSITSEHSPWVSGKRYLSEWMCKQEIVGVVFALIKDAEMHELHEFFRYKGAAIYNPHLDPDVLVEVAKKKSSFICREDSMTNA